jgi:hypothetical protein
MSIKVGTITSIGGNVTTLQWIKPGAEAETERAVGYHRGRLSQGYLVMLLKRMPQPQDFSFDGTTMRSGGREGLPLSNSAQDAMRPKVHDRIMAERGVAGYEDLQRRVLRDIRIMGEHRIAKLLPTMRHNGSLSPDKQYPMGGGGLQWVVKPLPFLAAAYVDANGTIQLADGRILDLRTGGYDVRAQVRRYLMAA